MKRSLTWVILSLILSAANVFSVADVWGCDKDNEGERFILRGSGSVFWNRGWEDRFFFGKWDSLNGPDDYMRTLRNTTLGNPEVWCRLVSSEDASVYVTLNYQHMSLSLRDTMSYEEWVSGEDQMPLVQHYKVLEAQLDFFSVGGRLRFPSLPFKPYLGENVGYCHGMLTTVNLRERLDNHYLNRYILVDGSGGGFFFDAVAGAQQKVWRNFDVFIEGGYRFTTEWHVFEPESIWTTLPPNRVGSWAWEDRHLKFLGPYLTLGVQVRL